ncbi:MAG TPA: CPBP family intramembrane glutamic endopeptidase [Candidatus Limnocylindrales bacterium]|nr:CPBP family intramembrane glutamic endopeptidase [Candidatus Limnocylindrales bacterium]
MPRARDPIVAIGLAAAFGLFALTFRGQRARFWERMTLTGFVLGTMALANESELRRLRWSSRDVVFGLGSAAVLYGVFDIGDRVARQVMPRGSKEIQDIYALRTLAPPEEIGLRLATVIGPAEELFWRGFVQRRAGGLAAAAAYGGVHLVTGNATLVGAAAIAGIYWGLLRALGMSMPALITSHIAWDIWIFLLAPTEGAKEDPRLDAPPF